MPGLEASFSSLQQSRFDLELLDVSLPDSQGMETLEKVARVTDQEVIIVLTATDDPHVLFDLLKRGAQDYLFKDTLNAEILSRSIRYSLERAGMIHRIEAQNCETKHREALQQCLFDASADAMLILTDEFEIRLLNTAAGKLLDADPDALVGEIFPFSVESGQPSELEIPGPGDSNRLFQLDAVDLVWQGQRSLLVVLREITDYRTAQLALNLEREQFNFIFDSIADVVVLIDAAGRIARMNPQAERITGISKEAACGKALNTVLRLKHPESGNMMEDPSNVYLSVKSDTPADEWEAPALCGWSRDLVKVQMCRMAASAPHAYVMLCHDMTQHKEREEALHFAGRMQPISQLAGGIAHDFNNMLTAVLGNISVARMALGEGHVEAEKLLSAEKAALQARSLTQQLLTFAKGGEPMTEATTIDQLVEDCVQFLLSGSKVKCKLVKEEPLCAVEVDRGQIAQVVNNLIINANQAMPDGGVLTVTLRNVQLAEVSYRHRCRVLPVYLLQGSGHGD